MKKIEKEEELSSPLEKKTARKTATKTTAKSASSKLKIRELNGTGTDVAYLLGVTLANVTQLVQAGTIPRHDDGTYNLVEAVSTYCRNMRERKAGSGKSDLELENLALKNEKLKEGLRSWRMQRDREVAMAILDAQRNAMQRLREECKLVPALVNVIDDFINAIDTIDLDQISYTVEGENEEDEE